MVQPATIYNILGSNHIHSIAKAISVNIALKKYLFCVSFDFEYLTGLSKYHVIYNEISFKPIQEQHQIQLKHESNGTFSLFTVYVWVCLYI